MQAFITAEIGRETVHVKATTLCSSNKLWDDFDAEQLKSVIFGLLRQNSFTFLEALEDARFVLPMMNEKEAFQNIYRLVANFQHICHQVDFARSCRERDKAGERERYRGANDDNEFNWRLRKVGLDRGLDRPI